MKIDEKIMKLRKQNAWSQEEFADKINVTRQTVSKWELGQTIPDTDKLTKIASLFGISVNDLLDENSNLIEEKATTNNSSNSKPLKILILIIILILVFVGIGAITINKIFNKLTNQVVPKSITEMFEQYSFSDIFDTLLGKIQDSEKESKEEFNKNSFNSKFKNLYYGSTNGFFMNNFIDQVLKSNEENPSQLITIKYNDFESNNANEIKTLKKQIKNSTSDQYEIYYEYDENGYINKAIIEDGIQDTFTNGTAYEIIYEYDDNGLINKAKIEK